MPRAPKNSQPPRKPRPNQVGVTLSPAARKELQARADELGVPAAQIAKQLLEMILSEGDADPGPSAASPGLREARAIISELRNVKGELASLSRAHHNVALKLLRRSGMSVEEVNAWVKKHLS